MPYKKTTRYQSGLFICSYNKHKKLSILFIAGIFVSTIPMVISLFLGKYVFKFHPAITLEACVGSRITTAGLGEIEAAIHSNIPALSYTTTYTVGNTILIIWRVVIVILMRT